MFVTPGQILKTELTFFANRTHLTSIPLTFLHIDTLYTLLIFVVSFLFSGENQKQKTKYKLYPILNQTLRVEYVFFNFEVHPFQKSWFHFFSLQKFRISRELLISKNQDSSGLDKIIRTSRQTDWLINFRSNQRNKKTKLRRLSNFLA